MYVLLFMEVYFYFQNFLTYKDNFPVVHAQIIVLVITYYGFTNDWDVKHVSTIGFDMWPYFNPNKKITGKERGQIRSLVN